MSSRTRKRSNNPQQQPLQQHPHQALLEQQEKHHDQHQQGSNNNDNNKSVIGIHHCFKILLALLLLQVIRMSVGGRGSIGFHPASLAAGQHDWSDARTSTENADAHGSAEKGIDNKADLILRRQKIKQLDETDPRQERILYDNKQDDPHAQAALDDYGSRRHMLQKNFHPEINATDGPYLIIGGSDGSGTRAVVQTLIESGVYMHYEDRRTYDVHGIGMFGKQGWPPLIQLAVGETHSANYELHNLTTNARTTAIQELQAFKKPLDARAETRLIQIKRHLGRIDYTKYSTAAKVGWKAPVSMLVLPLLQHVFGKVKFLHVVRDGRDIAVSENQGPVKKFYHAFYGQERPQNMDEIPMSNLSTMSMQLWKDANRQVMEYGRSHSNGDTFDYLTIRSEDLVNPETKFAALL